MAKSDDDKLEKATKSEIKTAMEDLWPGHYYIMVVPTGFSGNGTPDYIAAVPVEIKPEMVGETYAMFVGIEAKRDGAPPSKWTKLQRLTAAHLIRLGGFAWCVFGRKDVPEMVRRLKNYYHLD